MHSNDDAYALLEAHICPALDDVLNTAVLTALERRTIRRALAMLEETLGDVQEREAEAAREAQSPCTCGNHETISVS